MELSYTIIKYAIRLFFRVNGAGVGTTEIIDIMRDEILKHDDRPDVVYQHMKDAVEWSKGRYEQRKANKKVKTSE